MSNDWIFDVLTDLRSFALKNDMPELAGKVEEALRAARREVARLRKSDDDGTENGGRGGPPPGSRPN